MSAADDRPTESEIPGCNYPVGTMPDKNDIDYVERDDLISELEDELDERLDIRDEMDAFWKKPDNPCMYYLSRISWRRSRRSSTFCSRYDSWVVSIDSWRRSSCASSASSA